MVSLSKQRARAKSASQKAAAWKALAELFYHWDAEIQDRLAAASEHEINAYELGRALAETYWALDPAAPLEKPERAGSSKLVPNPASLSFLLGDHRRSVMTRLLSRLDKYFPPLTAPAVAGSIAVWGKIASSPELEAWRHQGEGLFSPNAGTQKEDDYKEWLDANDLISSLRQQTDNWYSLLIAELDPETLIRPYRVLRSFRIITKTVQVFALEVALGLIGLAAIGGFSYLLTANSNSPTLKAVFGAVGFLGVSAATIQSKLKNATQSIVGRLRQDLYTDLVAEQITVTPTVAKITPKQQEDAIGSRTVTAPLPS